MRHFAAVTWVENGKLIRSAIAAAAVAIAIGAGEPATAESTPAPSPSASAAATPAPDPAVLARAKAWYRMLQTGKLDRQQMSDVANKAITDRLVAQAQAALAPLGDPVSFDQIQTASQSGISLWVYMLTFKSGDRWKFAFGTDADGRVALLQVVPAT